MWHTVVAAAAAAGAVATLEGADGLTSLGDIDDMLPGPAAAVALCSFYADFQFHFDVARTLGSGGCRGVCCLMMLYNQFVVGTIWNTKGKLVNVIIWPTIIK